MHEGLVHHRFHVAAPLKHRSLALTGHEKRLDELAKGRFFQPGRLTLELLGAVRETPPLAWTVIRPVAHPHIVVFENAGPSDLAVLLTSESSTPSYDVVVYGGGKPFPSAISRLLRIAPASIDYVGDLDPHGIAIAIAALAAAGRAGLPPVRPAVSVHEAMVDAARDLGAPDGWLPADPSASGEARVTPAHFEWLPASIREPVGAMWRTGRRIPEEVLSPDAMRAALRR